MLPPSKAVSFRHLGTAYCLEQGEPSFLMSREDTERLRSRNGVAVIGDQDGLDKAWSDAFSTQTSNVLPAPNLDFTNEYVLVLSSFWEMLPNSKPASSHRQAKRFFQMSRGFSCSTTFGSSLATTRAVTFIAPPFSWYSNVPIDPVKSFTTASISTYARVKAGRNRHLNLDPSSGCGMSGHATFEEQQAPCLTRSACGSLAARKDGQSCRVSRYRRAKRGQPRSCEIMVRQLGMQVDESDAV